jgi:geranylgeranyl pyrophosphate synthase
MTVNISTVEARLQHCQARVEHAFATYLDIQSPAHSLIEAMRYSSLNGGKRLRPALVYATAECFGLDSIKSPHPTLLAELDVLACAVEMIHVYSLIHDDLPAMDNDALRRGQPTCHIKFNEATAILAGDALQTQAFSCIAHSTLNDSLKVKLIQVLANASGAEGMAGGQAIDLHAMGQSLTETELVTMHGLKTGALLTASITMGALYANAQTFQLNALKHFGQHMGLCFQIVDDILDVTGTTQTLGKVAGADQKLNKPTYPSVLGLEASQARAQVHFEQAIQYLHEAQLNAIHPLLDLAHFVVRRSH